MTGLRDVGAASYGSDSLPAIAMERVTFSYGGAAVVEGVSFSIRRGEMVALLGPNGAGKSTLLRLITGALRPQAGVVRLDGGDIRRLARDEIARRVALMPQDASLQFAYTVRQIVELGRMPHLGAWGVLRAADHHAVEEAMTLAGVASLADRVFLELSGGERQRALVALSLAQQAPTLLLDEPTAHLDIRRQIETLELLSRLNREQGMTVLATMHDINLAARYFPRLALYKRRVVVDDAPAAALDAGVLSALYETPVRVGILRGDERLSVQPPVMESRGTDQMAAGALARAHIIAGGGSGELLMRALADAGIAFSAGPLNVGDSDHALAERLALLCITEPPYAPVSPAGLEAARERMAQAQALIICPAPLGHGNVELLNAAIDACGEGVTVVLLEPGARSADIPPLLERVATRDFSGQGVAAYEALLAAGATLAASPAEAVGLIAQRAAGVG